MIINLFLVYFINDVLSECTQRRMSSETVMSAEEGGVVSCVVCR
jgi:hypothetical protein